MKTLCITGISEPDLLQIGEQFHQTGMAQPRSIERSPSLNIKEWHTRFLGNADGDAPADNRPLPGKFGEQLAGEIFFANMDTPFWGWQDSRSTWLLDFWADFDPCLVFVLVCFPLDYLLARRMETQSVQPLCVDDVVTAWKDFHGQLLQFYHRFPGRCLLVDVDDCATQFEAFAQSCQAKWNLPLKIDAKENHKPFSMPEPLLRHLAKDFLHNQPEATSLWNELAATLTSFSASKETSLQLSDLVASLHALGDRSREQSQIKTLGQANDALRLQLETLSSRNQESEKKWRTEQEHLEKTNGDLAASVDKLAKQTEARQGEINRLTKERDTLKTDLTGHVQKSDSLEKQQLEIKEENELLLLQLHQVQEELETVFLKNQEAEKKWGTERDSLKTDLAGHAQQLGSLKEQQRETNEENELLLLQLHQVQEELESIFLQKLEAEKNWQAEGEQLKKANADLTAAFEKQTEKTEARWQRMLERQPDYHDYQSLTVSPGHRPSSLVWQISNLEIGARHFSDLQFETFILAGVTGFCFTKPGEDSGSETSPLLRWPLEDPDARELDLIPVAERRQDVQRRVNALKGLTASDWHLLQPLARFLKARLQDRSLATDLPAALRTANVAGFDRFLEVIKNFPASLRYDCITLEEENCSEDCEQLHLAIENLSHGEFQCPRFEFCLSCAGLQSSDFGNHPRLEFPANASTVLKSWFDSSDDPEDPRLELRFAMPDAMDLDVWHKLSEADAEFLLMLVQHLPLMLEGLQGSDPELNRPWDQWLSLADGIEQILQLRTASSEPEEAA